MHYREAKFSDVFHELFASIHDGTSVASAIEGIDVSQRDTTNCGKNDSNIQIPTAHTDTSLASRYHGQAVKKVCSPSSRFQRFSALDRVPTAQFAPEQELCPYSSLPHAADSKAG